MKAQIQNRRPRCWPSPAQELLLRAALLSGDDALTAWKQWRLTVASAGVDPACLRLLSLLYHNLRLHGVEPASLQPYRAAYEKTWCENQFMFSHTAALVRQLQSAGIDSLLLKGVALAVAFYPDPALRPMADIDLLIHPGDAAASAEVCRGLGWEPLFDPEVLMPLDPGVHFTGNSRFQLDLHWRPFWAFSAAANDDVMWSQAISVEIGDLSTRCLDGTSQLLHVCVHGTQWCEVPSVRWVADSIAILRSQHPVDWEDLVAQTVQRKFSLAMAETLEYLIEEFAAPVPAEVLIRLQKVPVTLFSRLSYRALASGNDSFRTLMWWQLTAPLRSRSGLSWRKRMVALLRYVRAKWQLASLVQLPVSAVARLARKLWRLAWPLQASTPAPPARPGSNQA